jgi:hypothetical protein
MNSAALSPNGVYLAAATGQGLGPGTARIWDVTSGRQLGRLSTKAGPFWVVAWSPKGDSLAIGDHEGTIRTYRCRDLEALARVPGPAEFHQIYRMVARRHGARGRYRNALGMGRGQWETPVPESGAFEEYRCGGVVAGWRKNRHRRLGQLRCGGGCPRWSRAEQPTGPQQFCEDCGLVARWEMDCVGQSRESVSDHLGCFLSASHFGGTPEFRRAGRVVTRWQLFCARQQRY